MLYLQERKRIILFHMLVCEWMHSLHLLYKSIARCSSVGMDENTLVPCADQGMNALHLCVRKQTHMSLLCAGEEVIVLFACKVTK